MTISTQQIRKLRDMTGAGMMDCKEALTENNGDLDSAVQWLRKKGISQADRKAGRVAAEGLVGMRCDDHYGVLVEINSETDFVARNDIFQELVKKIADICFLNQKNAVDICGLHDPSTQKTVHEIIQDSIAKIGENIAFRRSSSLSVENGVVCSYMHNAFTSDMGKIGVLVGIETSGNVDAAKTFGRQVAMHIAASNPLSLDVSSLDSSVIDREMDVFLEQSRTSGKPENIIEKMVQGRMNKFYEESVLLHQKFVLNQDITVQDALKLAEKEIGAPAKITGFVRFLLGEGVEEKK